jgi:ubiquinone/menaquinone biosynthesis C-methylase UbiE
MAFIGYLIRLLARSFKLIGSLFDRLSNLLNGLVPAFLSSDQLATLVRDHYRTVYSPGLITSSLDMTEQQLESWEAETLERHRIRCGRMLVMGSGWGRESIAIARRGIEVIGVDTNPVAVRAARQLAKAAGVHVHFHQADLFYLPYAPKSFDFVILSSLMYSAIPGASQRQAWLNDLGRLLKPDGSVILSFQTPQFQTSHIKAFCARLNALFIKLPGSNTSYQPGDGYYGEHFMHEFLTEEEIGKEFVNAGMSIKELNWAKGFAVVAPATFHR